MTPMALRTRAPGPCCLLTHDRFPAPPVKSIFGLLRSVIPVTRAVRRILPDNDAQCRGNPQNGSRWRVVEETSIGGHRSYSQPANGKQQTMNRRMTNCKLERPMTNDQPANDDIDTEYAPRTTFHHFFLRCVKISLPDGRRSAEGQPMPSSWWPARSSRCCCSIPRIVIARSWRAP